MCCRSPARGPSFNKTKTNRARRLSPHCHFDVNPVRTSHLRRTEITPETSQTVPVVQNSQIRAQSSLHEYHIFSDGHYEHTRKITTGAANQTCTKMAHAQHRHEPTFSTFELKLPSTVSERISVNLKTFTNICDFIRIRNSSCYHEFCSAQFFVPPCQRKDKNLILNLTNNNVLVISPCKNTLGCFNHRILELKSSLRYAPTKKKLCIVYFIDKSFYRRP